MLLLATHLSSSVASLTSLASRVAQATALITAAALPMPFPIPSACDACEPFLPPPPPPASRRHLSTADASGCVPRESFIPLAFPTARLVRSNLGGAGGRCTSYDECDELQTASTPHEIYFSNVAEDDAGVQVDLRITNESEYRAWTASNGGASLNGFKLPERQFGVVHLLGPRAASQVTPDSSARFPAEVPSDSAPPRR